MSKKALIVGINYYEHLDELSGCVSDAHGVKAGLERNYDSSLNFQIELLTADNEHNSLSMRDLKEKIKELFSGDEEIGLLYFAGHGYSGTHDGGIFASDSVDEDNAVSFKFIMGIVNESNVKNKIVIIDACQSGSIGTDRGVDGASSLSEGVTLLTASTHKQYALETSRGGLFTSLLIDALNGGAANLLGEITPGGIYAHIDQSLGAWSQRPIFKSNVKSFVILKNTKPSLSLEEIRMLPELFENKTDEFQLDPNFEPDSPTPEAEKVEKFKVLQRYSRVNLVVPVGEEHMYYAAMNSKTCKLTILGEHYWNLVTKNRI